MNKLTKIPRNIFQTWKTKNLSNDFKNLTESWKNKNPNYAYFLYDDAECEEFLRKHFDVKIYNAFCRIAPGAFKADLWRYCILYVFGGIYVDIDTICYNSIDNFLNENIEFMTPIDLNNCDHIGRYNLFNAFIASVPKHPILLNCINEIVFNVENNIIPTSNLDFSGPGVLGKSTNKYLGLNEETSFIGKQGFYENEKICLLKFEYGTEYVKDLNNNILFQNKNGSNIIQNIYENEIQTINHINWGICKNPIKQLPTIVTMIYDVRQKENNNTGCVHNHKIDKYLELAKQFILKLPYPLVIFTDDKSLIEKIKIEREPFKSSTFIYYKQFEKTYFYKDLDKLHDLQTKFKIHNGSIDHETPMYIILNNNKFDCMESAIDLNPFHSTHFLWMDFGINHVALNTEKINEWIHKIPDKIKQLCINPFTENVEYKIMFQNIFHHMAGGLFSGSKENIKKYSQLFKNKTEEIYNDNWYQIDEAVMTIVQRENPDLFDLFYGDYKGIISNYLSPIHSLDLIMQGTQKLLDYNKTKNAYNILCYSLKYFENNPNSNLVWNFIHKHIIVDYYHNNNLLLQKIIDLINLKKNSKNNEDVIQIYTILTNNKTNISYYKNKELIL